MDHNKLNEQLRNLGENIHWSPRRQQSVRRKMIDQMNRKDKHPFPNFLKRWVIPAFSVLLFAAIITTLALSEFTGQKTADDADSSDQKEHSTNIISGDNQQEESEDNNENSSHSNQDNESGGPPQHNNNNDHSTTNDQTQHSSPPDTDNSKDQERTLTQSEILNAVKQQINTDLDILLPSELPLDEGYHLTATTSDAETGYKVIFYEHTEPIPINNERLFSDQNPAKVIARLRVHQYDNQAQADEDIDYENFSESGGKQVDLGPRTTGYQDGATGSLFTSWNVGRWALSVKTSTHQSDDNLTYAKQTVDYLNKKALPVPKPNGYAHLAPENGSSRIKWQKNKTVYTIDQTKDPDTALAIAVQFK